MKSTRNSELGGWRVAALTAAMLATGASATVHAQVTEQMIAADATSVDDVLTVGMG